MNGYKAFYKNKTLDVYANSSYQAQCEAAAQWGVHPSKRYLIEVVHCEDENGEQVEHKPLF